MKNIHHVIQQNMCAGCGLCTQSPEHMKIDEQGYIRPQAPIQDALSQACPSLSLIQYNQQNYDSSWGPVLGCHVGFSSDNQIRSKGASGGVITALLTCCLREKIVDGVIQVGKSDDNPIQNQVYIVTDEEELIKNAGSRYAPSAPLSLVRQVMGNGKKYAFVGKPCDVAGLRMAMQQNAQLQTQFPILLSFMCAGVPSQKGTEEILDSLGALQSELVDFRYRGDGWPGLTKATLKNGNTKTMTYNESWGRILNKHLQARCKVCADGTGEFADLVCADAWQESKNGYPSFEEQTGRSLILTRTDTGNKLLEQAVAKGYITGIEGYSLGQIKAIQPYQYQRKSTVLMRKLALKILGQSSPSYKGFMLDKLFLKTSVIIQAKAFLGTFIRKIKGRF